MGNETQENIVLITHAAASSSDPARPLTEAGRDHATQIGKRLGALARDQLNVAVPPFELVSSPALRCIETALIAAGTLAPEEVHRLVLTEDLRERAGAPVTADALRTAAAQASRAPVLVTHTSALDHLPVRTSHLPDRRGVLVVLTAALDHVLRCEILGADGWQDVDRMTGAPRTTPGGQWFRANTGVVVINGDGLVLSCRRARAGQGTGSWQFPQGGLDYGQRPYESAMRELEEETGIRADEVKLVAEHHEWLAYALDKPTARHGLGQVQRWYLVRALIADAEVLAREAPPNNEHEVGPEFLEKRWCSMETAICDAWENRRPIYLRLARDWADHLSSRKKH
jgi:putative (di)nucleoside polyphosphate hydrolase